VHRWLGGPTKNFRSQRVIGSLNLTSATRWGLNLLALLGGIVALNLGKSIIIPTIIALLLGAMLWPAVCWMNRVLRFSWTFACLVAVALLVLLNLFVTLGFLLAVPKLLQDMPDLRDEIAQQKMYSLFRERVGTIVPLDEAYLPVKPENSRAFQYVKETLEGPYIRELLIQVGFYADSWFWEWVLIMFLLLFMLLEGPMLSRRFVEIFGPSIEARAQAGRALAEIAHHVRTYLVWRTIVNFGIALVVGAIYQYVFHLKQAWTWAILTAVFFYVPYLGPLVAGVGPVLEAFITVSPLASLGLMALYAVILTVEGYLIVPVVMGHTMDLNATTVMLACLFWDLVWGLPGLFLAMPLMAGLKAVFTTVPDWQPWANLMSTSKSRFDYLHDEELLPSSHETQVLSVEEVKKLDAEARPVAEQTTR
jgi:predicted PurR-regulated permease PerM